CAACASSNGPATAPPAIDSGEASARRTRRILTIGMGNLNRRRAIGAARAAVRDDGGCLSRAAPERFTADGLPSGTNKPPLCLPMRTSPDTCLCKHVAYWHKADITRRPLFVRFRSEADID